MKQCTRQRKSKDWQKYRQQVALLSVRSTGKMLVAIKMLENERSISTEVGVSNLAKLVLSIECLHDSID